MNFNQTVDQKALVASATQFAQEQLVRADLGAQQANSSGVDHRDLWARCAKAGYCGLPLANSVGGRGLKLVDCMLIFEAMAAAGADLGFLFSLGVHQFAIAVPLSIAGSDTQRTQWLSAMASGARIGALAVSEREAGSDSYAMQAQAVETENGFAINGEKIWITNAPVADLLLVCARTDAHPGTFGISCFIVPAGTDGLSIVSGPAKAGLRGAPWGSVKMDDVEVPSGNMLGGRGGGAAVFSECMRWERCGLFAIAVGAMQKSLRESLAHVRTRRQFGGPLIDNDIVAKSIALMKTRLDTARLLLFQASATVDYGQADEAAICLAKSYVSEAAIANALAAHELAGAAGVTEQSSVNAFLNDMLPFRVLSGPTDVQYKIASRLLLRRET